MVELGPGSGGGTDGSDDGGGGTSGGGGGSSGGGGGGSTDREESEHSGGGTLGPGEDVSDGSDDGTEDGPDRSPSDHPDGGPAGPGDTGDTSDDSNGGTDRSPSDHPDGGPAGPGEPGDTSGESDGRTDRSPTDHTGGGPLGPGTGGADEPGTDLGSIDPSRVESATTRRRLLAAQRQAETGHFNPDNPFTPVGDTSGLDRLTHGLEVQTGRDVTPGEDVTVTGEGGEFGLRTTAEFDQAVIEERQQEMTRGPDPGDVIAGGGGRLGLGETVTPPEAGGIGGGASAGFAGGIGGGAFAGVAGQGRADTGGDGQATFGGDGQRQPTGQVTRAQPRQPDIPGIGGDQAVTFGGGTGELPMGPAGLLGEDAPDNVLASGAQTVADDPVQAVVGPPGAVESAAGDVAFEVRDASRGVEQWLNVNVVDPVASGAGDVAEATAPEPVIDTEGIESEDVSDVFRQSPSPFGDMAAEAGDAADFEVFEGVRGTGPEATGAKVERAISGIGHTASAFTAGLPAVAVETGDLVAGSGEFTASAIEEEGVVSGAETSIVAGGTFAGSAAADIAEQSIENPFYTTGAVIGGVGAGAATTPVRLASTRVPTAGGGTTAVRGVRVREPLALRPVTGRVRGRTLAGTRGFRPTLGAPSIRGVDTDLTRMGGTATATVEPGSAFEADVFRSTAADIGGDAAARFRSAEQIQRQAARRPAGAAGFEFETPEEAIGQARAVPEGSVEDVTGALRDLDATVFGSAAARAQLGEFRQPRDIDIVVRDEGEARARLGQALEGERATVGDVFDIKPESKVPGRARGGEEIKFGFESMEPRELGGVRFNPVEEEAIRKAGASAFLREPGAAGTPEFDIGPEPRRPGRADVREKDVTDTEMMSRELGFPESDIGGFERSFGLADAPEEAGGLFGAVPTADDVPAFGGAFARDVRGQAALGTTTTRRGTATGRGDADPLTRQLEDIGVETRRPRADSESPVGARRGTESPTPTGGGVSSPSPGAGTGGMASPFGMGGGMERAGPSPGAGIQDGDSPLPGPGLGETPGPGDGPGDDIPVGIGIPQTPDIPSPFTPPPPPPDTPGGDVPPPPPTPQPDPQPDPTPERAPMLGGSRRDSDDQEFSPLLPTGTEFQNPIASGTQFLFGGTDGDGDNGDDPAALFGF